MEIKIKTLAKAECLLKRLPGLELGGQFDQGIFAVTNQVFPGHLKDCEMGELLPVIIKIGLPSAESRENVAQVVGGQVGGWLKNRLENEANLLELAQSSGVFVPEALFYERETENGTELLVLERIEGKTCFDLRAEVSGCELSRLEHEKGKMLAAINKIPVAGRPFGPLSEGSMAFLSWQEYFGYKLRTTLLLLHGKYEELLGLEKFFDLAGSADEWRGFLARIGEFYKSEAIGQLISEDGAQTLVHGDYWDGNLIADRKDGDWRVCVIDWERGDIGGGSFDLALWLAWKVGGDLTDPDPLEASGDFLKGYREAGGFCPDEIMAYIAIYGLWQYLDFLLIDLNYGIDRSEESVHEIKKLSRLLREIAD